MSEFPPYLEFVVAFYSCITVVHLYLDFRQLKVRCLMYSICRLPCVIASNAIAIMP